MLAIGLSAVVAVATPTAQAKSNTGGNLAFPVDGTPGGQAAGGTFNIASFKRVDGVLTAVGSYSSATQAATPASAAVTSINGTSLAGNGSNVGAPPAGGGPPPPPLLARPPPPPPPPPVRRPRPRSR